MLGGLLSRIVRKTDRARRFEAAAPAGGRRWDRYVTHGPVNAEIGAAAETVRRRANHAVANDAWIANGVWALESNTVGAGIVPASQHPDAGARKAIQAAHRAWVARCDADGGLDWYGLQAAAVRAMIVDGEVFVHLLHDRGGLRLRLIPAEMVDFADTRELGDGRRIVQGVEFDAAGTRTALREAKRLAAEHKRAAEQQEREERADRERKAVLRKLETAAARHPALKRMVAPALKQIAAAPVESLDAATLAKAARALDRDSPSLRLARGLLVTAARVRRMAGKLTPQT